MEAMRRKGNMTATMQVEVECHSGHRGEETPRRFRLGERTTEVEELLDCWLAPDHRYFRLRGDDGAVYILRNDVIADAWELTMFDRTHPVR